MMEKVRLLVAALALAGCVPHSQLDHKVFPTFNELMAQPMEVCEASWPGVMFGRDERSWCPSQDSVDSTMKLVNHPEVLQGVMVIYVSSTINCSGLPAVGCSNDWLAFVHRGPGQMQITRHELTHISLSKRGLPKWNPGDSEHSLPIWNMIRPPDFAPL